MVITWYGEACFKIQAGEVVVKTDPFDKASTGLSTPYFNADVSLMSRFSPSEEGRSEMFKGGEPFTVYAPGEYELKGMTIRGVQVGGNKDDISTAYVLQWSDLKLVHLGHFPATKLDPRMLEACTETDILFVPSGTPYLEAEQAVSIINQIAPRIAIPMLYSVKGLTREADDVKVFLKEFGVSPDAQDKLTIKKKDLEGHEETQIVVLKAQAETN